MRTEFILAVITGIIVTTSFSNFSIQSAHAQSDELIDLDGIESVLRGGLEFQDVFPGATLTPFPADFPNPDSFLVGIDFFNQVDDPNGVVGAFDEGDDITAEDPSDDCPTAIRDEMHNIDQNGVDLDCIILDNPAFNDDPDSPGQDDNFAVKNGQIVDCDLETGGSPSGLYNFPCDIPNLTFYDEPEANGVPNGWYDLGEDIVLDLNGDLKFTVEVVVGGTLIPIDTTAVLLAGAQTTSAWMIPALVAVAGIAIVVSRKY